MVEIKMTDFYDIQKELNEKIFKCREISFLQIKDKSHLALLAELMELCNETRCFNYWSKKTRNHDDVILEEFSDVLCFSLSEYIYYGLTPDVTIQFDDVMIADNSQLVEQFLKLTKLYIEIKNSDSLLEFLKEFFILGYMLGYNKNQILEAYKLKCIKNHKVQDNW